MLVCGVCGYEAAEAFKFCPECGAAAAPSGREQRKVVTILFCDIVGSTALGETTDPEALRALLARYFERMSEIVERHGGTVEKFIGDAVMAVYGVPVVHEDDALRACRAALEMRAAFPELDIEGRIGITTGEVVTGTEERLATGDAVNVAARLQQAAPPGAVLIDESTRELLRETVDVATLDPLELKGKALSVQAFMLLAAHAREPRHERPFVGRRRELATIHEAWERALAEQRCERVTIVGEAGVGKSRLVSEALVPVETPIVQGRCLPYGEGITYWPVVEVIKQLNALPSDPAAAAAVRSLLGESDASATAEEIAWAFRRLLEEQAPLIVVFDDIQWGEETFLDLLEHLALLSSVAPLLMLCMARSDLLERRPSWPMAVALEPLPEEDIDELLGQGVPAGLRERIARAAGGNPLFVAEMLAMTSAGAEDVVVPPTLRALLSSRLDQLERGERLVLQCAAVEGEVFHRGAVLALAPEEQATPRLAGLVRKGLVRPDKAQVTGEDGFRFCHLLFRDAAYDSLPKAGRAELHESFAVWLGEHGRELVELDEILGYHLEQAARYKRELGKPDAALEERSSKRLAAAGRRALWRGDDPAAVGLLDRAFVLVGGGRLDVALELDLALAYARRGELRRAVQLLEGTAERACATGDRTGETLARLGIARGRLRLGETVVDDIETLARAALPLVEEADDHVGLARVWRALSDVAMHHGRYEEMLHADEEEFRQSQLAGAPRLGGLYSALVDGPRPADEALQTLDDFRAGATHPSVLLMRARLLAMLGRVEEASSLATKASVQMRDLTGRGGEATLAEVSMLAGDHEAAARFQDQYCRRLREEGNHAALSTAVPRLGRLLCALGRYDEAEPLARLGRELGDDQDITTQMLWRQVKALVHASRGEHAEAERLAREAIALSERTDGLTMQGDALCDLAEVLGSAGRKADAEEAYEQALGRYKRKHNLAMAQRVRAKLEELRHAGRWACPGQGLQAGDRPRLRG